MSTRDAAAREIRRALALLCQPDDVIELRVLNAGRAGTISGYYDDPDALTRDAVRLDAQGELSGIYISANPVNPALLARAVNRAITRAKHTTADADVISRRCEWLNQHRGFRIELNCRRQELWDGVTDRLRALLPKALDVIAGELEGKDPLPAAVHVLKACGAYGVGAPSGATTIEDAELEEQERNGHRKRRAEFAAL